MDECFSGWRGKRRGKTGNVFEMEEDMLLTWCRVCDQRCHQAYRCNIGGSTNCGSIDAEGELVTGFVE